MTAKATLKEVRDFFNMSTPEFRDEWTKGGLTDDDKAQLQAGIGDGSLNY